MNDYSDAQISALIALLIDCRTWLDPKDTGDDDSEVLCSRIDAILGPNVKGEAHPKGVASIQVLKFLDYARARGSLTPNVKLSGGTPSAPI